MERHALVRLVSDSASRRADRERSACRWCQTRRGTWRRYVRRAAGRGISHRIGVAGATMGGSFSGRSATKFLRSGSRTTRKPSRVAAFAVQAAKWARSMAGTRHIRHETAQLVAVRTQDCRPTCRGCSSELLGACANRSATPRSPGESCLRRRPRRWDRWRLGRQAEVVENPEDAVLFADGGVQSATAPAARAGEHIDDVDAAQQLGPRVADGPEAPLDVLPRSARSCRSSTFCVTSTRSWLFASSSAVNVACARCAALVCTSRNCARRSC